MSKVYVVSNVNVVSEIQTILIMDLKLMKMNESIKNDQKISIINETLKMTSNYSHISHKICS